MSEPVFRRWALPLPVPAGITAGEIRTSAGGVTVELVDVDHVVSSLSLPWLELLSQDAVPPTTSEAGGDPPASPGQRP